MKAKKKSAPKVQHAVREKYKRTIEWDSEDGIWVVKFPELPGCSTHGETIEEAIKNADEALELYLEAAKKKGIEVPQPMSLVNASGKFLIRTKPELHKKLMIMAADKDKSMNRLVEEILEKGVGD